MVSDKLVKGALRDAYFMVGFHNAHAFGGTLDNHESLISANGLLDGTHMEILT